MPKQDSSGVYNTRYVRRKRKMKGKGLTKKQKQEVKALVRDDLKPEYKHKQNHLTNVNVAFNTGAGSLLRISNIDQTTTQATDTSRIGDSVNLQSIFVRFSIDINPAGLPAPDSWDIVRVLIFQWRPDAAVHVPTLGYILQQPAIPQPTSSIFDPYNSDHNTEFNVLFDKFYTIDSRGGDPLVEMETVYINKGFNRHIPFNEQSNNGRNQIYIAFISTSSAVPNPLINLVSKLTFLDA